LLFLRKCVLIALPAFGTGEFISLSTDKFVFKSYATLALQLHGPGKNPAHGLDAFDRFLLIGVGIKDVNHPASRAIVPIGIPVMNRYPRFLFAMIANQQFQHWKN
jgi:hypothetical protein